jgi:hypothetical protein
VTIELSPAKRVSNLAFLGAVRFRRAPEPRAMVRDLVAELQARLGVHLPARTCREITDEVVGFLNRLKGDTGRFRVGSHYDRRQRSVTLPSAFAMA